jgi:cell wall-associated NlpC family hydrolase
MMWWNQYVGIPYLESGRDRDLGLDCAGLVCLVYREQFGLEVDQFFDEYSSSDLKQSEELLERARKDWHQVEKPQNGDVVLLRMLGHSCHVGVVVDVQEGPFRASVLNVRENVHAVIEDLRGPRWKNHIDSYWRRNERA